MVDDKQLATIIARDIFHALDDRGRECQRIEGKSGQHPNEKALGGFCETALRDLIEQSLGENRSY